MESIKVFKILSKFSRAELNRFTKFINSPFYNVNKEISLYSGLIIAGITKNQIQTKEELYQSVFNSEFNDQKFRTLNSKLLNLVEQFITIVEFNKDTFTQNEIFQRALLNRKLDTLQKKSGETSKRNLDRSLEKASKYFLHNYKYELNKYKGISDFEKISISGDPLESSNIFDINLPLDQFYYISKLRYINELITYNYMYKLNIDLKEFDQIEKAILEKKLNANEAINIFYLLCKSLMEPEVESYYKELRVLQNQYLDIFGDIEKREIFNSTLNYAISKANKGNKEYYNEILDLYELGIKTEVLLIKQKLSATSFRNIVFAAMRINKYEYAINFIETNADLLKDADRQNAVNFSLARIAMNQKDWRKAVDHISSVDFEDQSYNLNSRLMMLNAYYELDEYNALESLIDSYTVYLGRKKAISEARRVAFKNHLKFLNRLLKVNINDKSKIQKLKVEITETPQVINKAWLLEKIEEL